MSSFVLAIAGGIGRAISANLLVYYNFVPHAETQSVETIRRFYTVNFTVPAVLSLFALLIWVDLYLLTKSAPTQMISELAERWQQASESANPHILRTERKEVYYENR